MMVETGSCRHLTRLAADRLATMSRKAAQAASSPFGSVTPRGTCCLSMFTYHSPTIPFFRFIRRYHGLAFLGTGNPPWMGNRAGTVQPATDHTRNVREIMDGQGSGIRES